MLDAPVPHPATLSKLTRKYGPDVVHELNRLRVQRASERKLVRSRKLRVDTAVVQAPIDYPTDIGLRADGARVVTRSVRPLQAAGAAVRTAVRSRARSIKRALATVGRSLRLRTEEAKTAVLMQTAFCGGRGRSPGRRSASCGTKENEALLRKAGVKQISCL